MGMADRALLIRLGALGDTLHASSAAVLLKRHRPEWRIEFLCSGGLEGLFAMIPEVAEVHALCFRGIPPAIHPGWRALRRRLRKRRYRLAYLMETDRRFLPLLHGIEADRRIDLGALDEEDPEPVVPNPVRYQRGLWRSRYISPGSTCAPLLVVDPRARERAEDLLASLGMDPAAPLVGLHPGNSFQERRPWRRGLRRADLRSWPEGRWCELIETLHRLNPRIGFVLFGGPRDGRVNTGVMERVRKAVPGVCLVDAAGRTDLPLAAAVLQRFTLFVCTDTGPLHMAAALGVPFVGLYGPTRYAETRPYPATGAKGEVLRRSMPCQPCYGTPMQRRCKENLCMRSIRAGEVVEAARRVNPGIFDGGVGEAGKRKRTEEEG